MIQKSHETVAANSCLRLTLADLPEARPSLRRAFAILRAAHEPEVGNAGTAPTHEPLTAAVDIQLPILGFDKL